MQLPLPGFFKAYEDGTAAWEGSRGSKAFKDFYPATAGSAVGKVSRKRTAVLPWDSLPKSCSSVCSVTCPWCPLLGLGQGEFMGCT